MLSKLSVKKPLTVFVCVFLVLVLGVVSFLKMTPDLLPNMDFPYIMIMTTYTGQTPETVEASVSRPLESALYTVDGVKQITSTSTENYSMLLLEFEDGTNMDTATVDVRSGLDAVSDAWSDEVGTPYLIKANPNILPVAMMAVDYKGKDRNKLSDFVTDTLKNRLEGIDGVASVSDKGVVTRRESVMLSQKKLDALNKKINAALDSQFAKSEKKIKEAKGKLEDGIKQAQNGSQSIGGAINDVNSAQGQTAKQFSDAQTQASDGGTKLTSAQIKLQNQKSSLEQTKKTLETTYKTLLDAKNSLEELKKNKTQLTTTVDALDKINKSYQAIQTKLQDKDLTTEEQAALNLQLGAIDKQLEAYNLKIDGVPAALTAAGKSLVSVNTAITTLENKLREQGADPQHMDTSLNAVSGKIKTINTGIAQLEKTEKGLDDSSISVNQALAAIAQQRSSADYKMSGSVATLAAKQGELNTTVTQLNTTKAELDKNLKELNQKKKEAKEKADVNNTVTTENVAKILEAQNFSMPAGYVTDNKNNRMLVRVGDEVKTKKELSELALFDTKIDGLGIVKVSDVADVLTTDDADDIYTKINQKDGVVLSFSKQSDVATSTVCDNINNAVAGLQKEYDGLNFTTLYSQGNYIDIIVNSVLQNLLMGAALAIIILFLFLRDLKPTLIVAVSIPVSVVFAIVLMYFSGVTLNMISLSGLAIGVGMLVDNSVVVIENIYRLRAKGYNAIQSSLNGARQVAGAIIASTLTTICVFAPIVFVEGITRQLFVDMALTVTYSLLASLIVALTLVPAMSQGMLRKIRRNAKSEDGAIKKFYEKSIRVVLRHKIIAVLLAVALLLGSGFAAIARGFSFMPKMNSTQVQVNVTLDPDATFEETVAEGEKLSKALNRHDEFETVGVMAGNTMGAAIMGVSLKGNDAGALTAYGVLKSDKIKQGGEIADTLKKELADIKGEVTVSAGAMDSMSQILGTGGVELRLHGDDLESLRKAAEQAGKKLESLDGIESVDNGIGATSPEIRISVDKKKAAQKGLTVAQVFQKIASAVAEEKVSTALKSEDGSSMDVVIVKDEKQKIAAERIGDISIQYTDKDESVKTVALSKIAKISRGTSMNTIARSDQKRYISIEGALKKGAVLTDVTNRAKSMMKDMKLPDGVTYEFGGTDKQTMDALKQLALMLLLGVILIYFIMVAQFQSLKSPLIIMFTIPLAFTGGFLALLVTGFDVSVISMLGFVMLCGIIVNNGIVLVDYTNKLRINGMERREAIVEAGKTRMRPIFITALTTVLGLSVMALGIGTGAEMMQPLAIVCIGGLLYATIMTLYIVPVIYDWFNRKKMRKIEQEDLIEIMD